jgi:TRAP-type C4-dicarboxylate transport system permease small subunit
MKQPIATWPTSMPASDDHAGVVFPDPDDRPAKAKGSALELLLNRVATGLAVCGGVILIVMACLTTLSILGRNLFDAPLRGDFELVEYGAGLAAALFLPLAQLHLVHPRITVFSNRWPSSLQRGLDAIGFALTTALSLLLSIQLARGAWDAYWFNDETMILQLPSWFGIAVVGFAFGLMSWTAMMLIAGALAGRIAAQFNDRL